MRRLDSSTLCQIGDRPRDLEHSVIRPGREGKRLITLLGSTSVAALHSTPLHRSRGISQALVHRQ